MGLKISNFLMGLYFRMGFKFERRGRGGAYKLDGNRDNSSVAPLIYFNDGGRRGGV